VLLDGWGLDGKKMLARLGCGPLISSVRQRGATTTMRAPFLPGFWYYVPSWPITFFVLAKNTQKHTKKQQQAGCVKWAMMASLWHLCPPVTSTQSHYDKF
jgi:hypothetical protein